MTKTKPKTPFRKKKAVVRKFPPEVTGLRFPELETVYDFKKLSSRKNPYQGLAHSGFWESGVLFTDFSFGQHRYPEHYFEDAQDMVIAWRDFIVTLSPPSRQVMIKFPIGPDGKYLPGSNQKYVELEMRHASARGYNIHYQKHNPHVSPLLEDEVIRFFAAVTETWTLKHKEMVEVMRNKLENDPEYLAEYNLRHNVEKTQATIEVLKHLNQLRGAVDAMISGIQKGYVSQGSYETYCHIMNSLGKDKRPVTMPVRQHFLVKNSKKK